MAALASFLHIASIALMGVCFFMRLHHLHALDAGLDRKRLAQTLFWDNVSLVVVLIAMGSGFWRLFGGLEKPTAYYTGNLWFWVKMGVLGAGWALEWPVMMTLIRWRMALGKGQEPDVSGVARLKRYETAEGLGMFLLIGAAALMAHGYGQPAAAADPLAAGRAVYLERCSACHGASGAGNAALKVPDFTARPSRLEKDDSTLRASIENGVAGTGMVGWKDVLTGPEIDAVLRYLRAEFGQAR